eukprot:TRINITY_DN24384_c0_g1_i1.p1 TRINITY_DN24384_c0_g1~~TRINITY_DN24384_c0_g1_i1.p1  ORF type:complete len:430 (-),score=57.00 TRINITY_DN24384_c0_g1_i1:9-1298(-)
MKLQAVVDPCRGHNELTLDVVKNHDGGVFGLMNEPGCTQAATVESHSFINSDMPYGDARYEVKIVAMVPILPGSELLMHYGSEYVRTGYTAGKSCPRTFKGVSVHCRRLPAFGASLQAMRPQPDVQSKLRRAPADISEGDVIYVHKSRTSKTGELAAPYSGWYEATVERTLVRDVVRVRWSDFAVNSEMNKVDLQRDPWCRAPTPIELEISELGLDEHCHPWILAMHRAACSQERSGPSILAARWWLQVRRGLVSYSMMPAEAYRDLKDLLEARETSWMWTANLGFRPSAGGRTMGIIVKLARLKYGRGSVLPPGIFLAKDTILLDEGPCRLFSLLLLNPGERVIVHCPVNDLTDLQLNACECRHPGNVDIESISEGDDGKMELRILVRLPILPLVALVPRHDKAQGKQAELDGRVSGFDALPQLGVFA